MSEPILEVRDLHVEIPLTRGTVRAVDGSSFTVAPGEAIGRVGESGSGKSMTLHAILGLLPHPAGIAGGEILYEGADLVTMSAKKLQDLRGKEISMIFQEPMTALNPVMRVGDQIAEGPLAHLRMGKSASQQRALDLMRQVGIPDPERRARAFPHELSGGMRQRVMIAIALSCEPKLILCDEPTTALDVTIQDQILKLLRSLREERGLSVVFVTHDLAVVAQTCQRLAVMYAGQVVETGSIDETFRSPRHPYTVALLNAVLSIDPRTRRLAETRTGTGTSTGTSGAGEPSATGCAYANRCPHVMERCRTEVPAPIAVDAVTVRCHLFDAGVDTGHSLSL